MKRGNDKRGLLREGREAQEGEGGVWGGALAVLQRLRDMLDSVGKVRQVVSSGVCHRQREDLDLGLDGELEASEEGGEQSNNKLFIPYTQWLVIIHLCGHTAALHHSWPETEFMFQQPTAPNQRRHMQSFKDLQLQLQLFH